MSHTPQVFVEKCFGNWTAIGNSSEKLIRVFVYIIFFFFFFFFPWLHSPA
jgi:hypothetical protein